MVVDSSVWLAIIFAQPLKDRCLREIKNKEVFVPSLCFYECFKKIRSKVTDHQAMEAISSLLRFSILDLNAEVALTAAELSLNHNLAMADSIVLAHARLLNVALLTLDNDFAHIPNVVILRK